MKFISNLYLVVLNLLFLVVRHTKYSLHAIKGELRRQKCMPHQFGHDSPNCHSCILQCSSLLFTQTALVDLWNNLDEWYKTLAKNKSGDYYLTKAKAQFTLLASPTVTYFSHL